MLAYICDSCGTVIQDPCREKVTEYIYNNKTGRKEKWKRTIHLCESCCQNLRQLGARLSDE